MRLTAKERILLHLLEVSRLDTALEVPPDLAQEGVARGSCVDLRHLPQYIRPLMSEGLVCVRQAHVRGIRQRRKVYSLTEAGTLAAVRLRERAQREPIQVRDSRGTRSMRAYEVLEANRGKIGLAQLAWMSSNGEVVDLPTLGARRLPPPNGGRAGTVSGAFVEMLRDAPRVGDFVGRERELSVITEDSEAPRVILVRGIAGIGKSWLAAQACELLRGKRNLFWHRIRPWDTRKSVLAHLGEFLSALGRPGLRSLLLRGDSERASEVLRVDLPGARAFLVFDDAHEAAAEVVRLLNLLKEVIADVPDVRALICSRRGVPGFGQKDLLQELVRPIELEGLSREEVLRLLEAHEVSADVVVLGGKTGGHPLSLRLLKSARGAGAIPQSRRGIRLLLEDEIYRDLSNHEKGMMKVASLYRVPVPREALFAGPGLNHDVLLSLADRSLLRPVGLDSWEAHDSIRDFFANLLTPSERARLGKFAAHQLQTLARSSQADGRVEAAVSCLSNAAFLAPSEAERLGIWEALGDAHELMGNLPEALTAYGLVARSTQETEQVARAHRKSAFAYLTREESRSAEQELDEAEAALRNRRSLEWGWIQFARGYVAYNAEPWKVNEAAERSADAVAVFRRYHERAGLVRALCLEARIAMLESPSGADFGRRCFEEALVVSEQLGNPVLIAEVHVGFVELFEASVPDPGEASRHLRIIQGFEEALADPWVGTLYLYFKGMASLEQGAKFEEAEQVFLAMERMCRRYYDTSGGLASHYGLGLTLYYRGRLREAETVFDEAWAESRSRAWLNFGPASRSLWMSAMCRLRRGDLDGFLRIAAVSRDPDFVAHIDPRNLVGKLLHGMERLICGDWTSADLALSEAVESMRIALKRGVFVSYWAAYGPSLVYACALRARGRDAEADANLRLAEESLRVCHLKARQVVLPEEEREVLLAFRKALAFPHAQGESLLVAE